MDETIELNDDKEMSDNGGENVGLERNEVRPWDLFPGVGENGSSNDFRSQGHMLRIRVKNTSKKLLLREEAARKETDIVEDLKFMISRNVG